MQKCCRLSQVSICLHLLFKSIFIAKTVDYCNFKPPSEDGDLVVNCRSVKRRPTSDYIYICDLHSYCVHKGVIDHLTSTKVFYCLSINLSWKSDLITVCLRKF